MKQQYPIHYATVQGHFESALKKSDYGRKIGALNDEE